MAATERRRHDGSTKGNKMTTIETLKTELGFLSGRLRVVEQRAVETQADWLYKEADKLREKAAALTAAIEDMERMEWLEQQKAILFWQHHSLQWVIEYNGRAAFGKTPREAIDSAQKEQP